MCSFDFTIVIPIKSYGVIWYLNKQNDNVIWLLPVSADQLSIKQLTTYLLFPFVILSQPHAQ